MSMVFNPYLFLLVGLTYLLLLVVIYLVISIVINNQFLFIVGPVVKN